MEDRTLADGVAAILVALMLLVTAWSKAWLMPLVAGLALVGLLLVFKDPAMRQVPLPGKAAAFVALAVFLGIILLLRR